MTDAAAKPQVRRRWGRWLFRQTEHGLAALGLAMLVYYAFFDVSRVVSGSMAPTLRGENWQTGDLVLSERVSYWLRRPRRWEIITFRTAEGMQVMKRVIGVPGERVEVRRDGQIIINGQPLERPADLDFLHYFPAGNLLRKEPVECGDGYYLLGDNALDSDDSRFNPPVRPDQLIGRAWLILAPAGRRGFVNP
ncbi:MAG: signal peptidase I [Planctomycetaceae bacterium]|nr:signal peptidase I [Planctomycetaceae bacterium]